jgi:hypothetical protein
MSSDQTAIPARSLGAGLEPFLERLDAEGEALAARTEAWSAINSGSFELAWPQAAMRAPLFDTPPAMLPGNVEEVSSCGLRERVRP